jgi:hypothetical protein
MNEPIISFRGEYRFLSNFYPAEVYNNGISYPKRPHNMELRKTVVTMKPGEAKRWGKELPLKDRWAGFEFAKLDIMHCFYTLGEGRKVIAATIRDRLLKRETFTPLDGE